MTNQRKQNKQNKENTINKSLTVFLDGLHELVLDGGIVLEAIEGQLELELGEVEVRVFLQPLLF